MVETSWLKRIWNTFTGSALVPERETVHDASTQLKPTTPLDGMTLLHTLQVQGLVRSVVWSPDGQQLVSNSRDGTVRLWDPRSGKLLHTLEGHRNSVRSVAWSPDGQWLASGSGDRTVRLWDPRSGKLLHTFQGHTDFVTSVAWSPDGQQLVSYSADGTVRLWDPRSGKLLRTLEGHTEPVWSVAWSPDGQWLASCSDDKTVRLWNPRSGKLLHTLEGHRNSVYSVAWSPDGALLVSSSNDGESSDHVDVRIWHTDTWDTLAVLTGLKGNHYVSWHPCLPVLVTSGQREYDLSIWNLDLARLLHAAPSPETAHYTNAKVVLVGDSGVGKSGLSLVLSGQSFAATESTHGRYVWSFDHQAEVALANGRKEMRETLLWDLAGQPGYRLIHQLHLNEVTVALVVFDAHSETDPFAGVEHWCRALAQAQRVQGSLALPLKKLLVQARSDRGNISVSLQRIQAITNKFGLDGYFTTSAKEGWGIVELQAAIRESIEWDILPKVTSTVLFQQIKEFLIVEKESRRLISTENDLYFAFLKSKDAPKETAELPAQFETCIGRVESAGLIRRLSFGKLVLLQPEMLDTYAYALVNSIKGEPDGLGSITEERVRRCDFRMPQSERIKDPEQERLLLIAMVENLLRSELALREEQFLVFPSQSTRENPDLPDPEGQRVMFAFEGPIQNIYAMLAVRLSHSGLFKKKDLWKNAITYTANVGGTCGLFLHNISEGHGELILFFDQMASEETRFNFEEYIQIYLQRRVLQESLKRQRIFTCNVCNFLVTEQLVRIRAERGFDWLDCSGCGTRIMLLDREQRLTTTPSRIVEMDRAADNQRNREVAKSTVQGKQQTKDFDVFLCHNGQDKPAVKQIGKKLKLHGILPWLDEWELRPGLPWQQLLEVQIAQIKTVAVFVGKGDLGPWQHQELDAFLREFARRGCPVIPVLLADTPQEPVLPVFLKAMTWVDFRCQDPDPMQRLLWGITGKQEIGKEIQGR